MLIFRSYSKALPLKMMYKIWTVRFEHSWDSNKLTHTGLKLLTVNLKELLGWSLFVRVISMLHKEMWAWICNNFKLSLLFDSLHMQMAFLSETLIGIDQTVFLLAENARCKRLHGFTEIFTVPTEKSFFN